MTTSFADVGPCGLPHPPRLHDMDVQYEQSAGEIKRLQRCINDLVSLLALPAIWSGGDISQVLDTLLNTLMRILRLDLVSVQLNLPVVEAPPIEIVRIAESLGPMPPAHEICEALNDSLADNSRKWPPLLRNLMGDGDVSMAPLPLGLQGELGMIVAAAQRSDFPQQTEALLLSVATSQACIGLQEARLRSQQKRIAAELDQQVAQRTAELAAAEERWRSVFENSAIGVALTDLTGRFLAANPVYEKMVGYSQEELQKLSFLEVTLEEFLEPNRTLVGELLEGKRQQFQIEKQYRRKNGTLIWVRNNVSLVPGTERVPRFLMALSEDITERRRMEEALNKARSELAHVSRVTSLGALTASIAHEINQPLSGIITNASTCLRMLATDPPQIEGARETARRTIRDGNRASEVITRLRALYSKKDPLPESVDLNEATREVIALSLSELQRSRVTLRLELADDLPLVTGDRVQLQQVILNLVLNASDAMSGVEDRPRQLVIRTERGDDRAQLTVQDVGVGIEPSGVDRVFEPFYTTKSGGMGVGLSVSRSIVESHHGRLWATVNEGPGAAFSFSIPQAPADFAHSDPGREGLGTVHVGAAYPSVEESLSSPENKMPREFNLAPSQVGDDQSGQCGRQSP
ncbi:MAG: PAS domain S-box protein [Candidatus Sulfotelmatobacter sp.]